MIPTAESLRRSLSTVLLDRTSKGGAINEA
jgi:hypothetical protein